MTSKDTKWKHRKITAMFAAQGGRCWWCSCETILMVGQPIVPLVRNRATIDHLRDRTNPSRSEPCKPGETRLVMACWECNNERGNAVGKAVKPVIASALPPLKRSDLHDLHSVLRRAAERAERNKEYEHAEKLAREIAALDYELAVMQ